MEEKNTVTLNICGTEYIISSEENAGYMQELGVQVDTQIRNIMNTNNRISLVMAAVMTALDKADEAKKATQTADNLRKQLKSFFDDNNRSRSDADNLRRQIQQLQKEKQELERKLASR